MISESRYPASNVAASPMRKVIYGQFSQGPTQLTKRLFEIRRQWRIREQKRVKRRRNRFRKRPQVIRFAYSSIRRTDHQREIRVAQYPKRQVRKIEIPAVFSIIDDPETAIEMLDRLAKFANDRSVRLIQIDHSKCVALGLCASTAMDVILLNAQSARKSGNALHFQGQMAKVDAVNLMLRASGILRHLGLPESRLPPELEEKIRRCDLFRGKQNRIELGLKRDVAATSLTDYFDSCLRGLGHELTLKGRSYLSQLITEIIGNAEEHGGPWATIGHWYFTGTPEQRFGECHLVLMDQGNTIYESLSMQNQSEELLTQLRSISDLHRRQGFFSFARERWDEETLWTLYALQERVSRYAGTPRGKDRGNGTVNFIEFFRKLAGESGKMCICSGKAYILFDGKYHLQEVPRGDEMLKVIAFNAENDLERPPDAEYVHRLSYSFPGTIVSIRLTLDESYLSRLASSNGDQDDYRDSNQSE